MSLAYVTPVEFKAWISQSNKVLSKLNQLENFGLEKAASMQLSPDEEIALTAFLK